LKLKEFLKSDAYDAVYYKYTQVHAEINLFDFAGRRKKRSNTVIYS
jgi:hypothetical protein